MILDPNGMPILQPTVDNAETATFNDAFAAIGNAVVAVENVRQIKTYKWADNAARTAQTGMTAGDEGYQTDTDTTYIYSGSVWRATPEDTGFQTGIAGVRWETDWSDYDTTYRRVGDLISLRLYFSYSGSKITAGSEGNIGDTMICTLPTAFAPPDDLLLYGAKSGYSGLDFKLRTSGGVQLTGASFPGQTVESGDNLMVYIVYMV